ncbi:MAG: phytanoyl-CoA dioxygenase [Verrucomicrobia bacterium]|jgi:ectoine hydroxylase-related dioxygenase (phytanoyl-CoA dioxygenase family)|nr:phytanoyl-CoA dioxygenase [Verrucomicrobiota bacterium]
MPPIADIKNFAALCEQTTEKSDFPHAERVSLNVPIYDGIALFQTDQSTAAENSIMEEWRHCLHEGSGVFAIENAYANTSIIEEMTHVFRSIIKREKETGASKGDHFGNNERIWNSIQKTSLEAPQLFADYYGNPFMALACRAWLGPHYQMTAQVNIVKPGSKAQSPHRDYHLGFQSDSTIAAFPIHAQIMSQFLTLQGAIVHNDMAIESGPTQLLPFSQQCDLGYLEFRRADFCAYFQDHFIQVPLKKGDLLFFNPALFHAAGMNRSGIDRVANLIQVSSAFGRPMETIDHFSMIETVYPELSKRHQSGNLSQQLKVDSIAALADGYAFPTNLDSDPPIAGNAPRNQGSLVTEALDNHWPWEQLGDALNAHSHRQKA